MELFAIRKVGLLSELIEPGHTQKFPSLCVQIQLVFNKNVKNLIQEVMYTSKGELLETSFSDTTEIINHALRARRQVCIETSNELKKMLYLRFKHYNFW